MMQRLCFLPLLFAAVQCAAQWGSNALADTATVSVRHGACAATLTGERMHGMYPHEAVVVSKDGERHTFRGPLLRSVLLAACPSIAELDKHAWSASAVKVTAQDGYVAVVAGMELDSTFQAKPVILAVERGGPAIDAHNGPFQLVVPDDLRHARNVRSVRSIEVLAP